jgi:sugar lactone lactonase YvrE
VGPGGSLTDLKPFANRGGESVAVDPSGNVYVANGEIFVYAPDGTLKRRIDTPERPLQLIFGGENGRTLFILSHHSLYAIDI